MFDHMIISTRKEEDYLRNIFLFIYLFIYLEFYVTFNTVSVISGWVVGRAEETSRYSSSGFCTVNCGPMAMQLGWLTTEIKEIFLKTYVGYSTSDEKSKVTNTSFSSLSQLDLGFN